MKKFIKKTLITKTFTFSKTSLCLSIFITLFLETVPFSSVRAGTCTTSTSAGFISCLSSIASSGDTIKLTGSFTLPATVAVPNKTLVLDPNGFDMITGGTTFSPTGNPSWTVIFNPNTLILKQSTQNPYNNFSYLTSQGSLSAFLGFVKSGGVLAIEFQSFEAQSTEQGVVLNWLVAEDNATEFVVERSMNGKDYTSVGSIKVKDYTNSGTPLSYTFTDSKPAVGSLYYRIKSADVAGKIVYSRTITISNNKKMGNLKIYPNPIGADGYLNIETDSDIQNVVIANAFGQVVLTSQLSRINTSELLTGIYHISIKTDNTTVMKKFIKQ